MIRFVKSTAKLSTEGPTAKDSEKIRTMFDQEAIIEVSHLSGLIAWLSSVSRLLELQIPAEWNGLKRQIESFSSTPLPEHQIKTSSAQVSARFKAATIDDLTKPVTAIIEKEERENRQQQQQQQQKEKKKNEDEEDDEFDELFSSKDKPSEAEIKRQLLIQRLESFGISQNASSTSSSSSSPEASKKQHALENAFTSPPSSSLPQQSSSATRSITFQPPTNSDLIPQIVSKFEHHCDSVTQHLWFIPGSCHHQIIIKSSSNHRFSFL